MSKTVDRRQFLGVAAASGTAAGLALSASATTLAAAPSNRVILGVMGLSRGAGLAAGFVKQPNVEIKYVCDVDTTRAASCAGVLETPRPRRRKRSPISVAFWTTKRWTHWCVPRRITGTHRQPFSPARPGNTSMSRNHVATTRMKAN